MTPVMGDLAEFVPHDAYVYLQGAWVDTSTAGGTIVSPTYLATVTDGVLTSTSRHQHLRGGPADRRTGLHRRPDDHPTEALPLRKFDFGPAGMPVASGYTRSTRTQGTVEASVTASLRSRATSATATIRSGPTAMV